MTQLFPALELFDSKTAHCDTAESAVSILSLNSEERQLQKKELKETKQPLILLHISLTSFQIFPSQHVE